MATEEELLKGYKALELTSQFGDLIAVRTIITFAYAAQVLALNISWIYQDSSQVAVSTIVDLAEESKLAREGIKASTSYALFSIWKSFSPVVSLVELASLGWR